MGKLVLENHGLTYVLADAAAVARYAHPHGKAEGGNATNAAAAAPAPLSYRRHAYHVAFVGARAGLQPVPAVATGEVRNYLRPELLNRIAVNIHADRVALTKLAAQDRGAERVL